MNTLFYGDNLDILREHVGDASVDLIYLDPPFNSKRDYNVLFKEQSNVLFKEQSGEPAQAQGKAFTDTWKWSERVYHEFCGTCRNDALIKVVSGFVAGLGRNDVTAYIVMMAPRLLELHRVLKSTGSLYLHCDPAASHYLKVILDRIFNPSNFRNEIIWERHEGHSDAQRFGSIHDVVLYYRKSNPAPFRAIRVDYSDAQLKRYKRDEDGRLYRAENLTGAGASPNTTVEWRGVHPGANQHWMWSIEEMEALYDQGPILLRADGKPRKDGYKAYLDEMEGKAVGDVWSDIPRVSNTGRERLGYPTQKPLRLLRRIIEASSSAGDTVLDPFCGCGTAVVAAEEMERKWLGIDITHVAISLIKTRLLDSFTDRPPTFREVNIPTTEADARALAVRDRHEFQMWAISLVPRAYPYQARKGADSGIDGVVRFQDDATDPKRCIIQVKSGKVQVKEIRDFNGTIERERAVLGLFITLDDPTAPMLSEAERFGFYRTPLGDREIQICQIRTVAELLGGKPFDLPIAASIFGTARADAIKPASGQQEIAL